MAQIKKLKHIMEHSPFLNVTFVWNLESWNWSQRTLSPPLSHSPQWYIELRLALKLDLSNWVIMTYNICNVEKQLVPANLLCILTESSQNG